MCHAHLAVAGRRGVNLGDTLTALGGRLTPFCSHNDCSCWLPVNASETTLLVPDEPLVPAAVFLGASKVGSCSDIALDITSSTGSGGRNWVGVSWTINGTLPAHNLTKLKEYVAGVVALDVQMLNVRQGI